MRKNLGHLALRGPAFERDACEAIALHWERLADRAATDALRHEYAGLACFWRDYACRAKAGGEAEAPPVFEPARRPDWGRYLPKLSWATSLD